MLSDEAKSLIHLSIIPGVGDRTIRCLLTAFGSAEKALTATFEELVQIKGLARNMCRSVVEGKSRVAINEELELIQAHDCHLVTIYDSAYPLLLKQIDDPPLLLYVRGELGPSDALSVAVVGSRSPTNYGKTISRQLSHQLADQGVTVISGLARGIDTCAHQGVLEAGGRTIAVMGNGLSQIYPDENKDLADAIAESGAVVSEFPMNMPPIAKNFPRRNRVISGICSGTVVVEASDRSGSLITARCAAEQGREVFAVPGQIFSKLSKGTHQLINQGATLVNTIDDLLDVLPPQFLKSARPFPPTRPSPNQNDSSPQQVTTDVSVAIAAHDMSSSCLEKSPENPPVRASQQLSIDELTVLEAIATPFSHIDQIARTTELPINKVSGALVMLELKGIVQQLPGKQFARQS